MVRSMVLALLLTAMGSAVAGCAGESSGTLIVDYQLGTGATCKAQGVTTIRIRLQNSERDSLPSSTFPCTATAGQAELADVPSDVYTVVAEALNASGTVVLDDSESNVTISEGRNTTLEMYLWAVGLTLQVEWRFLDGRFCSTHNVHHLHMVLARDSAIPFYEEDLPCEDGSVTITDLLVGTYDLVVWGVDPDGLRMYSFQKHGIEVSPQGNAPELVVLEPVEDPGQ
jgi:hypothetical protein